MAVVSTSAVPTGRMVIDVNERFPELAAQLDKIDAATRSEHNLYLDAQQLSERLFGDHMMTNTLALGAAYQRGLLPVSAEALERAIELNGAAVEKNLAALRWGRAVVASPDAVEEATRPPEAVEAVRELSDVEREIVSLAVNGDSGELRRLAEHARTGARGLPGRRLGPPLGRAGSRSARGRAGAHARPLGAGRGRGPPALQADGLQGRVRGRAPAPRRRRARQAGRRVRRGRADLLHAPPAAAARARPEAQAEAGPLVRAGVPSALPHAPPAWHPPRPVRSGRRCAAWSAS